MKSGFVSVVGRANVGKSTLMEKILKEKISIISNKPQTTRDKINIIYNDKDSQIIFIDTPGIQMPRNKLQVHLLDISKESLKESDIITMIVDDSKEIGGIDSYILDLIKDINISKILLINKTDLISKEELDRISLMYSDLQIFDYIIPVSAKLDINIDIYIDNIKKLLYEGPLYYSNDILTDKTESFVVSEIIREKTLLYLDEEVPHGIFVRIDSFKKRDKKNLYDIYATIIVEKKSHKQIVIGKNASMLTKIGKNARIEIEKLIDSKVNLQLWVSIENNWRRKQKLVERFGYK